MSDITLTASGRNGAGKSSLLDIIKTLLEVHVPELVISEERFTKTCDSQLVITIPDDAHIYKLRNQVKA
jgi:ABC-type transport system involved in cytochrome c biogenesis ATPase subunit